MGRLLLEHPSPSSYFRETVHCYPRNVDRCFMWSEMAWCCCWHLSAFLKICFCLVLLYNKSLNDWSLGEQWILFPSNLNVSLDFVSGNIEILAKQNSLFPSGPVIECLMSAYSDKWDLEINVPVKTQKSSDNYQNMGIMLAVLRCKSWEIMLLFSNYAYNLW